LTSGQKRRKELVANQILVVEKRNESIRGMIPYLEKIVQPGTKVVFLFHYPMDGFGWLQAHWGNMETGMQGILMAKIAAERYSLEEQRRRAKVKVLAVARTLLDKEVRIAIDVHAGPLRKVVRSYTLKGDVHLILMGARRNHAMARSFGWASLPFGWFRRPSHSLVLLFHPCVFI
jgi:hypothetical protein